MKLLLLLPFRLWLWLSPCSSPVADNHVFGHLDLIKEIRIKENKKKTVYLGQQMPTNLQNEKSIRLHFHLHTL